MLSVNYKVENNQSWAHFMVSSETSAHGPWTGLGKKIIVVEKF